MKRIKKGGTKPRNIKKAKYLLWRMRSEESFSLKR